MKEINKLFSELGKKIYRYGYKNGEKFVETDSGKYIVKSKSTDKNSIYNYLLNRGFDHFLRLENNYGDSYEIYKYIDDDVSCSDKAIDLVYLLSMLHTKTTTYRGVVLDNVKKVYEKFNNDLEYLNIYYHQMQDYIESKVYMAPDEYLLIRNISLVYELLNMSKNYLEHWYSIKKEKKKERVVFLHNNLSLANFIDSNHLIFKNWDKARKDWVVFDFYNFYRNDYRDLEFSSLYEIYQSKYRFTDDERLLFFALISKIWKVDLKKSHYNNCIVVDDLVSYLKKTRDFVLKYDEENQKANQEEFN